MNIILAIVGIIVVDDELDVVHVEAPGGHVGGDQDGGGAGLELSQHPVPLLLLLVPVDAHGGPSVLPHQSDKIKMFKNQFQLNDKDLTN